MQYFNEVTKIKYEGPTSTNPLAFKEYNPDEIIMGKSMKEQLRFSMSYWHTLTGEGSDPFGAGTAVRPWDDTATNPVEKAKIRVKVAFEFMEKLGMEYCSFHDRDM